MIKQNNGYLWGLLVVLVLFCWTFGQDFQTRALGNTDLVLTHWENRLDIYTFSANPAFLIQSEKRNWVILSASESFDRGDFKRYYDPESKLDLNFRAEGVKFLSEREAFWGKVNYSILRRYSVPRAIERQPYADDPLVMADTTTGHFSYDGPQVNVQYQYQLTKRFGLGAEVFYEIGQGIKDRFTRPRIIHRDFGLKLGSSVKLKENLILGGYFNYLVLQDQTEIKRSTIDGRDPFVLRYRSELVYRLQTGTFDRYVSLDRYIFNLALHHRNASGTFNQVARFDYAYLYQETFDETAYRIPDSDWYASVFEGWYQFRWQSAENRRVFGARLGGRYLSSFSQHPTLAILITDRTVATLQGELGMAFRFRMGKPLMLAFQGGYSYSKDQYNDYQSEIFRELSLKGITLNSGLNISLNPIHSILLGFQMGNHTREKYSPRYLPDYNVDQFSLGLLEKRANYHLELYFEYFVRKAVDSGQNYHGWQVALYTKILK